MYKIGELSDLTKVKPSTIRFYEKCGFLENVERLENGYRIYNDHHKYQVIICSLVFGGFVNKNLRKSSMKLIFSAQKWDIEAYKKAAFDYKKLILQDIERTHKAIDFALNISFLNTTGEDMYTKKQAAQIIGTTEEAIRNWERNGLIPKPSPYQKRYYSKQTIHRMHVIRLLLDIGYSIMTIKMFLEKVDLGLLTDAKMILTDPKDRFDLQSRADYYFKALLKLTETADSLYSLHKEMENLQTL